MEASKPTRTIKWYGDDIPVFETPLQDGRLKLLICLSLVPQERRPSVRENLTQALRSEYPQIALGSMVIFSNHGTDGWYYATIPANQALP